MIRRSRLHLQAQKEVAFTSATAADLTALHEPITPSTGCRRSIAPVDAWTLGTLNSAKDIILAHRFLSTLPGSVLQYYLFIWDDHFTAYRHETTDCVPLDEATKQFFVEHLDDPLIRFFVRPATLQFVQKLAALCSSGRVPVISELVLFFRRQCGGSISTLLNSLKNVGILSQEALVVSVFTVLFSVCLPCAPRVP
jgi:hypothetical protein